MKRNKNIDICRACATLLVVLYHIWVLSGAVGFPCEVVTVIVSLGGEVGVTAFFVLSGFGIYCSLYSMDKKGEMAFLPFMKKRLLRIFAAILFVYRSCTIADGWSL